MLFKSRCIECFEKYCWDGSLTDLTELITPIWKLGKVRNRTGEAVTKKELIGMFELLLDVDLKNFDVIQSKAADRKKDAPFLNSLLECYCNLVNAKLE